MTPHSCTRRPEYEDKTMANARSQSINVKKAVKDYFKDMRATYNTGGGTDEESYYPAFSDLMNKIGKGLSVVCVAQLRDQGADHPDFGLYAKEQSDRPPPVVGQADPPKHGVIEAKGVNADLDNIEQSEQVTKYLRGYQLVMATNYREFRLFRRTSSGKVEFLESLTISNSADEFWRIAESPQRAANSYGTQIWEFLNRSLAYRSSVSDPKDVAWFLASYAREALANIERVNAEGNSTLRSLKTTLETGLGGNFTGQDGSHQFCSTLVQTLFYGLFSAWVAHARSKDAGHFEWQTAGFAISIPLIQSLFGKLTAASEVDKFELRSVLNRASDALNRVNSDEFFDNFDSDEAIQHFYEPFLSNFDPKMQEKMGVWYTPPEIVKFMVKRVDTVLREEFGIEDGLADEQVEILDPCCGTGTYVVEILRRIKKTLRKKRNSPFVGDKLKKAATTRVFGFEIMPAPYVIAHWRVAEFLKDQKAPLSSSDKAKILLTNTLSIKRSERTGQHEMFEELEDEQDEASEVKTDRKIMVVIGNPPYNSAEKDKKSEEVVFAEAYSEDVSSKWGLRKFSVTDSYVMFFRAAERRIEKTGYGIVSFISNSSWVADPSYVGMRKHLLDSFDNIWIENMHGNRLISERAPDDSPSQTIFAMKGFTPGIKVGTAIGLLAKKKSKQKSPVIRYRNDIDAPKAIDRRKQLLKSLKSDSFNKQYDEVEPQAVKYLALRPMAHCEDYPKWPRISKLAKSECQYSGLQDDRNGALIHPSREAITKRMKLYCNPKLTWDEFLDRDREFPRFKSALKLKDSKKDAEKEGFSEDRIIRFAVRPFENAYAAFSAAKRVWHRPRLKLWDQFRGNEKYLLTLRSQKGEKGTPAHISSTIGDYGALGSATKFIPFHDYIPESGKAEGRRTANLSSHARSWLQDLGLPCPDSDEITASMPWYHVLSISHSPKYASENSDMFFSDFPRIPMPNSENLLRASSQLGKIVSSLLNSDKGISSDLTPDGLNELGLTQQRTNLGVAKWGFMNGSAVVPSRGSTTTRAWDDDEHRAIDRMFASMNIDRDRGIRILGNAVDVYLNDTNYWKGIPEAVYDFRCGNYQVIKKWLSYRDLKVIKREITGEEADHVTDIVWRLTILLLMGDSLDANYEACSMNSYVWPNDVPGPIATNGRGEPKPKPDPIKN